MLFRAISDFVIKDDLVFESGDWQKKRHTFTNVQWYLVEYKLLNATFFLFFIKAKLIKTF